MTPANDGLPLQVTTDPGSERCEGRPFCGLRSRWRVAAIDRAPAPRTMSELAGGALRRPIRFACENHLLGALAELLEHPLLELDGTCGDCGRSYSTAESVQVHVAGRTDPVWTGCVDCWAARTSPSACATFEAPA